MSDFKYLSLIGLDFYHAQAVLETDGKLLAKADKIFIEGNIVKLLSGDVVISQANIPPNEGTKNYADLINKPTINGIQLVGNKTTGDLGIVIPTKLSSFENDKGYTTVNEVDAKIATAVASAITYKGTVGTIIELEAITSPKIGDMYNVSETDMNYIWNGTVWDEMAPIINVSNFVLKTEMVEITQAEIDALFA